MIIVIYIYKMSDTGNKFCILHYTCNSMSDCFSAIDTIQSADASDSARNEQCCRECQWLCWPIIFVADIVSCPCRCGYYYCYDKETRLNCCNTLVKSCSCKKKSKPTITIQPQ